MTYPCEIIMDLLPLYIDNFCSEESKTAIKTHLSECEKCRKYYAAMKESDGFVEKNNNSEEMKMADSLKKVKTKINGRVRNIIICAALAALVFTIGFQILFNAPIKNVDKENVKITAEVYPFSELPHSLKAGDGTVEISLGENDTSDIYKVEIPSTNDMQITTSENVMEREGNVTVITSSSKYFLRSINWEIKDDTIYISSFKTTILNNKAKKHQKTMTSLEFREINKIVYLEKNGDETVLWKRENRE